MSGNAVPPPSNSQSSSIANAAASPTASAQMSVQPASDADRSRIADRIAIARAEGHGLDVKDDDWEDEDEEDFVAVDHEDATDFSYYFRRQPPDSQSKLDELHPFVQLLSLSNVDDCVTVEASFPEPERCSREKVRVEILLKSILCLRVFLHVVLLALVCFFSPAAYIICNSFSNSTSSRDSSQVLLCDLGGVIVPHELTVC